MSFNFTEIREYIRIKAGKINIKVLTASGKDGAYFVTISPALLVSGYGANESEAIRSFEHNLEVFCKDLLALPKEERDLQMFKLGFAKEKFKTKNFSKLYIDESGVLQGLESSTVITSVLEAIV